MDEDMFFEGFNHREHRGALRLLAQRGYYTEFHGGSTESHRVFPNFAMVTDSSHAQNDKLLRWQREPEPEGLPYL